MIGAAGREPAGVPARARTATSEDGDRLASLDGLRGIAILLVLIAHVVEGGNALYGSPASGFDRAVVTMSSWGWTGVDLFFVLSGFLITGILFDAKSGSGYFRTFYARRILRIFPLYYGYLIVVFLLLPLLPALSWESPLRQQSWYWVYLQDLPAVLQKDVTEFPFHAPVGHLWSLAIEEQFYLIWPAVVLAFGRRRLMAISVGCVIASLVFRVTLISFDIDGAANYSLLPGRMGSLAIGALIALAARSEGDFAWVSRWAMGFAAASAVGLAAIIAVRHGMDQGDPYMQSAGYVFLGLLCGALVVDALVGRSGVWGQRLYTSGPLRTLGRYSYGLYVLQGVAILLSAWEFDQRGAMPLIAGSRLPIIAAFSLVAAALTFAMAWLSWHAYESQILKFKRYFPRAGGARSDAMPQPHAAGDPQVFAPAVPRP